MANRYRNLIYSNAEYTHLYGSFKGVEQNAGSLVSSKSRLAYSENMYKDYDANGADVIESIPGFRCFAHYGEDVHAIYYQRSAGDGEDHIIVHVGDRLMRHPVSDIDRKNTVGERIATVRSQRSFGFEYGRFFYVMDGESILRIDEDGACEKVGDGAAPYVPTTHVSGEEYEARNLLTDKFKEETYLADPTVYSFATDGLKITITDAYLGYCAVSGISSSVSGAVYIPAYVNISGTDYKVTSIADNAFASNRRITSVIIAHGVSEIGKNAFMGCSYLTLAALPPTVKKIGAYAFSGCTALMEFYLGAGVSEIGENAFMMTYTLGSFFYALGESDFKKISGYERLDDSTAVYNTPYESIRIALRTHDSTASIEGVSADGEAIEYSALTEDGEVVGVILDFPFISDVTGMRIVIEGTLKPLDNTWCEDMTPLFPETSLEAVTHCTLAEVFDGRIFFSGNPAFPNTVFYTDRGKVGGDGALSVGRYNYFNDGVGSYKVRCMLAVRDMLAVFKEGDDGSGSIFYHKREATSLNALDTVYPVAYVHSGISASGCAFSFLDDPVFLCSEGIMALNSENINYQRNVVCRSHNVNYTLLKSDLSSVSMCEWLGYLVVGIGETVLLADSRALFSHPAGSYEYEWFMLKGIGAYTGSHTLFRYADSANSSTLCHPTLAGEKVRYEDVMSATDLDGVTYYYVTNQGYDYLVEPSEERSGGVFHPAKVYLSHGKRLFFATGDGHLCVFNNDKRGVAPDSVREKPDFDEAEYKRLMGDRIHPDFYAFDSHAARYAVRTALDDCGIPHLTKSTVKKSLVIKAKSHYPGAISCEVITDNNEPVTVGSFPAASVGFDSLDFRSAPWYVSRYSSVALAENEKRWIEKQISLICEKFACPISISSISYRYIIKGKIKNNV